jgi:hypothetical protein
LVVLEVTDLIFAVDSIPAILAVTTDTFVVYTSNVFALLGMRALYFLLAGAASRFRYLQPGLAFILAAVAVKLLTDDLYQVPAWASPAFIAAVLAVVAVLSLRDRGDRRRSPQAPRADSHPSRQPRTQPSSSTGSIIRKLSWRIRLSWWIGAVPVARIHHNGPIHHANGVCGVGGARGAGPAVSRRGRGPAGNRRPSRSARSGAGPDRPRSCGAGSSRASRRSARTPRTRTLAPG